ncbi:MAG TPA: AAA family ATPase [Amycolatopsis sp.]|nr:AAA family ATPase [Amycolatopsis sp.]
MQLYGRKAELKTLAELLDGPGDRIGALIRGETGIGKSALLEEAVAMATVAGLQVVTTAGAEAEQHLAYAGLHRLLYALRAGVDALPIPQRDALGTVLGLAEAAEPNTYLVGLATLSLLAEAAVTRPLLVVAEDVHWLDPASAEVLAFVARRIEAEPIVLVATIRDGDRTPLEDAGLSPMPLDRLSDQDSAELLDSMAPRLTPPVRVRLLAEAAGNPLALAELPSAVAERDGLDPVLSLGERLERAFSARVTALPAPTRTALLVAALNQTGSAAEILAAAGFVLDADVELDVLAPAVTAQLIELGVDTVTFRHPLMRSAIPAASTPAERRQAHLALAATLAGLPGRCAWHQAAATSARDESVATELELAAARARRRGAVVEAIASYEQAARLSEDRSRLALRLLRAAELATESGRRDTAERLLREAQALDLTPRQRAAAGWLLSGFEDGVREDVSRISELIELADANGAEGNVDVAMRVLWGAAMRCFWSEPGPSARKALLAVLDRLPLTGDDPRKVAVAACVAPFERGAVVLDGLRKLAGAVRADPDADRLLGNAAMQVGAFDLAARFTAAAAPRLRAQGRLGLLPRALAVQAWCRVRLGDLATAVPIAAEAAKLAQQTHQPFMYGLAVAIQAEIGALRGDHKRAQALADEAERVGLAAGARPVLATVQLARGLAALGEGRFEDAFADLRRMLDATDPAYQLALSACCVAELTEAAVRSGQTEALREALRPLARSAPSPALHIGLRYARAMLARNDEAEELFLAALRADLAGWPAERGRVRLAFGEWLRRQRRVVESRTHLRMARETFDALGMTAWGERARRELRSAGETSPNRGPDAREKLTPHELGIAQLAAEGLTNREIGQRLYLSHRTVGTHLHRIFPKLGVNSRADLARTLGAVEKPHPR